MCNDKRLFLFNRFYKYLLILSFQSMDNIFLMVSEIVNKILN